ncbi:MAG TPA: hypothetical protein VFH62_07560 [Dehalococcoidia bacterium]|nr:hypothetical protein [Dehalococcoidia bacterium]
MPAVAALVIFIAAGADDPLVVVAAVLLLVPYAAGYGISRVLHAVGASVPLTAAGAVLVVGGLAWSFVTRHHDANALVYVVAPGVGMLAASLVMRWQRHAT